MPNRQNLPSVPPLAAEPAVHPSVWIESQIRLLRETLEQCRNNLTMNPDAAHGARMDELERRLDELTTALGATRRPVAGA